MSWPAKEDTTDAIDWSYWQQNADGSWIDVDEFVTQNPSVKVDILRACCVNGAVDKSYAHYANAFRKHKHIIVIAYLWPNPMRTDMIARWTEALLSADEMPDGLMLDFELTFYQTDEVLTKNAEQSFKDAALFDLPVIGYTRGNWWELHIKTAVERGRLFIVAHYPHFLLDGKWQQCRTHADLHAQLPIGNSFTPYLGRLKKEQVIGWQVCAKGRLAPYAKDMDLDSLLTSWVLNTFGGEQPFLPIDRAQVTVTHKGPVDIIVVEGEYA